MNVTNRFLLGTTCFFAGMVAGFLFAPIKKGIYCGNNSGNVLGSREEMKEFEIEDEQ